MDFTKGEHLLTTQEVLRLVHILSTQGVRKVRFTGGEPLVRRDILKLVDGSASTPGVEEVHLTTNGVLLERHMADLGRAGLTGVNISLDTLRPERFHRITRRHGLDEVLQSIQSAVSALQSVKVNVVAMRGVNDDEILDFARMTRALPITVRFIELMPFDSAQVWKTGRFLGVDRIRETLTQAWPQMTIVTGSATETWTCQLPQAQGKVALIPAFTRSLCGQCNRIRITADGKLRNCLYSESEYSLRALLREDAADGEIIDTIRRGVMEKKQDGWEAQRATTQRFRVSMTQIGG